MTLISLVDPDLSQEETAYNIIQATLKFNQVASDVFNRLDKRLAGIQQEFQRAEDRYQNVKSKIATLQKMETAVVLRAPSQFPNREYVPAQRILPVVPGVIARPFDEKEIVYEPRTSTTSFDVKSELEQRKQFFAPSKLMGMKEKAKPGRKIPKDLVSVCDLFYEDSDQAAFDGVGGSFVAHSSKSKSVASRMEKKKDGDNLDRSAIGGKRRQDDDDPFAFRPSASDAPELDLPDFLPDLPGVAMDLMFTDLPPIMASLSNNEEKFLLDDGAFPINSDPSMLSNTPPPMAVPPPAPPPHSVIPPPPTMVPPPPPPPSPLPVVSPPPILAPPPPPPPPPPTLTAPSTPLMSPAEADGRSDLMAAIRSAGGLGSLKLKKGKTPAPVNARKEKEKQSLRESSALPSTSNGGDLMSSLAKALESRRKAIAGSSNKTEKVDRNAEKAGRLPGAMGRISDMIPPPPSEDSKRPESGDEDWS